MRDAGGRFERERRRHTLVRHLTRLRHRTDDWLLLRFDDLVQALGQRSQSDLGIQTIPLETIVGTVGRQPDEFDRAFRPASHRLRDRWLRVAAARRYGSGVPPIEVYRVGDLHFVEDGHHRVSVARAMGDATIDAHVRLVRTVLPAPTDLLGSQLELKHHERASTSGSRFPRRCARGSSAPTSGATRSSPR